MICYRDQSFCADQDRCAVRDCNRRLSDADRERAVDSRLPVAWAGFAVMCSRFDPLAPDPVVPPGLSG